MVAQSQSQQVHGLAADIRAATESETFDLGGLAAVPTIETTLRDSLAQPFGHLPPNTMIRITFVVGAGKQGRQKYDPAALKTVTTTLQSMGFVEDRGASCIIECAGMYKLQHDTGKNLKTVVVFPKLAADTKDDEMTGDYYRDTTNDEEANSGSVFARGSLESKVAISTLPVFQTMVQSKCSTWSQKKVLLQLLEDSILGTLQECETLLVQGQVLTPSQESFYDSCRQLTEKQQYLQQALHAHVDRGDLTQPELQHLLQLNEEKLEQAKKEQSQSKVSAASPTKLQERHDKLVQITPIDPPKLQHHAALGKLWKQLAPLQHLDETSGKLLSIADTQLLGKKMDLLEQIEQLEQASRGWLEDEQGFQSRLDSSRKQFRQQFGIGGNGSGGKRAGSKSTGNNKSSGGAGSTTISSKTKIKVPVSKWVTPTETKQSAQAKKKARLKKGDVFGAMMVDDADDDDDDSDDNNGIADDEDDDPVGDETNNNTSTPPSTTAQNEKSINNNGSKSKNKKNKKKKGTVGGNGGSGATAGSTPRGPSGNDSSSNLKKPQSTTTTSDDEGPNSTTTAMIVSIFQDYVLVFLLAVVTWLVGSFTGGRKNKSKKQKNN